MTCQIFMGKEISSEYCKYRFKPPEEVTEIFFQFFNKKVRNAQKHWTFCEKRLLIYFCHIDDCLQKAKPHVLAVDLGCGTGQISRLLAPHFQEVVAIDVSESQLEEARAAPGYHNITYRYQFFSIWRTFWRRVKLWIVCYTCRKGRAEDLPFPKDSVDLITASSAAHYFDKPKFMSEANRVLKPGGCIGLFDFTSRKTKLHYQDCGERLTDIYQEVS